MDFFNNLVHFLFGLLPLGKVSKKKKILENSNKGGGRGSARVDFPIKKEHLKLPKTHFKTNLLFFQLWPSTPSPTLTIRNKTKKAITWSVGIKKLPISYKIHFMARRSFFVFLFSNKEGGGQRLIGIFQYFFFFF